MSSNISWNLVLAINDGELGNLRTLMAEMVEATKANEKSALLYEWFINEEESELHINERYKDAEAVLIHLGNFGEKFAERFMTYLTIESFSIYGPVTDDIKGALTPLGAKFYKFAAGF